MKIKTISREENNRRAEALGIPPPLKDHPLRSEGSSIHFLPHTPERSLEKVNVSGRTRFYIAIQILTFSY